jgi:hypothetical protein
MNMIKTEIFLTGTHTHPYMQSRFISQRQALACVLRGRQRDESVRCIIYASICFRLDAGKSIIMARKMYLLYMFRAYFSFLFYTRPLPGIYGNDTLGYTHIFEIQFEEHWS